MRYLLILFFIVCYSCKNNSNTTNSSANETAITQEVALNKFKDLSKNLPAYSEDFSAKKLSAFIVEDDEGYYINKNLLETNLEIQSVLNETKTGHDTDNWMYNVSGKEYLPLYKATKDEIILIGSFVEYTAENNIPGVSFQLHTFDTQGNQIDYLVVFNRLNFEMVLKSEFEAASDFSEITVTSVEEEWLSIDEDGVIRGEFSEPVVSKASKTYSLTEAGTFSEK